MESSGRTDDESHTRRLLSTTAACVGSVPWKGRAWGWAGRHAGGAAAIVECWREIAKNMDRAD
jgi:hypothetical protein